MPNAQSPQEILVLHKLRTFGILVNIVKFVFKSVNPMGHAITIGQKYTTVVFLKQIRKIKKVLFLMLL